MPSPLVRISETSHKLLRDLAREEGAPMPKVLDLALEQYRRQKFLEQSNAAFQKLKQNRKLWRKEQAERKAWDTTLSDGLD